jgi:hypothetical protein
VATVVGLNLGYRAVAVGEEIAWYEKTTSNASWEPGVGRTRRTINRAVV